jgi:hypothetical protein
LGLNMAHWHFSSGLSIATGIDAFLHDLSHA